MTSTRDIFPIQVFNSLILAANDSAIGPLKADGTEGYVDLGDYTNVGEFGCGVSLSGSGRIDVEYLLSYKPPEFVSPTGSLKIFSDFSSTSGSSSNGQDIIEFTPEVARFLQLKVSETSGNDCIVSLWLGIL